ncbi:MAG: aminotransferase class I/II-fold pyridoxal phosphate-dependent enzyme, partial [Pseudonocardiaceae bacterium]
PAPPGTRLRWLNSPSNPTGAVAPAEVLAAAVAQARSLGAVVASDECYLTLGWEVAPVSVLHPTVHGGILDGLLAVHSLSKSSNLAGYRAGFVAGDPALVGTLLAVRRHAGMIVPRPVQQAMVAALVDDTHVAQQRARYAARRDALRPALAAAGLRVDHSEGGLYLWCTAGEPCRDTVDRLAARGVLVAPGEFYGPSGSRHVRVALTASDERIAAAVGRLAGSR